MRRLAGWMLVACVACSSKSSAAPSCPEIEGSYVLNVMPTGQSENLGGACSTDAAPQAVAILLTLTSAGGSVSLNGETCAACTSGSCQVDVICGSTVACPDAVVAEADAGDSYVQSVSFDVPQSADAETANAVVELGPAYCGYFGTASIAP